MEGIEGISYFIGGGPVFIGASLLADVEYKLHQTFHEGGILVLGVFFQQAEDGEDKIGEGFLQPF